MSSTPAVVAFTVPRWCLILAHQCDGVDGTCTCTCHA